LGRVDREKELKLVHWEDMYHKPYFWFTFYIQVNFCRFCLILFFPLQLIEFEGGGLAVGLSCTHLLIDPTCAAMFIKAWADITLGGKMLSPPLFYPLPLQRPINKKINRKPYTTLVDHYKSSLKKPIPIKTVPQHKTVTFSFTQEMSSFFWVIVNKTKRKRNGLTNMSICLDMRKLLGLDNDLFGNCMVYNKVHGKGFGENGLLCGFNPICFSCYIEPEFGERKVLILPYPDGVVMVTLPEDEVVKMCEDDLLLHFNPRILMGFRKN
ncbi:hypothetical protein LOK49_LG13G02517, partial [Camellia lanceoleosa]